MAPYRALSVFGEDIVQLTQLAAALRAQFRGITIVHTEEPLQRAVASIEPSGPAILVCLRSGDGVAADDEKLSNLAFVLPPGPEFDALQARGAACFRPESVTEVVQAFAARDDERARRHYQRLWARHYWPVCAPAASGRRARPRL